MTQVTVGKFMVWMIVGVMLGLAACGGTVAVNDVPPPPTVPTGIAMQMKAFDANQTAQAEYVKMLDAQRSATVAAANAQGVIAQVTAQAVATREAIGATVTRQALNEQATRQAQIVGSTATAQALQATRAADDARATSTMQSAYATATGAVAQFTATAHAQNMNATATAQSALALATQASASATATARAADAQATRVSASATETVTVAQVHTAQEKADWDKRLESLRAIAFFVGVTLVLVGLVVLVGFAAIRFIDAGVLRARVFRDKTGTVFVVSEKDEQGRQAVFIPGRAPGAVLTLTPPNETPLQIEAQAVDPDTTKRDQAVSLMLAANTGKGGGADDLLAELGAGDQVRIVDSPPAQIISGDVPQLLDGDWQRKELGDGRG